MGAGGGEGEAGNGGFAHGQRLGGDAELLFQLAFQRIRPDGDRGHHAAAALHHGEAFGLRADETARDLRGNEARRGLALVLAATQRIMPERVGRDMGEIGAAEIGDGEFAEDVIENRCRALDRVIALHEARRLEAREGESIDIFFQRHAILQAERDRDGEIVHQRAESGAFLVHVDENLADAAVFIFAGAEIDLVPADNRLLGVALAAVGEFVAVADPLDAFHNALDDLFRHGGSTRRIGLCNECLDSVVGFLLVIRDQLGIEGLGELRPIAIKRIGLEREFPREHIGALAILDSRLVRHVDGFRDRTRDEGLRRRHHADMAFNREIALADATARIGAIEHGVMLEFQVRGTFQRHRATHMHIRRFDIGLREAEEGEKFEGRIIELLGWYFQISGKEINAQVPFVKHKLDVESGAEAFLELLDHVIGEALGAQCRVVDAGRLRERAMAHRIGLDLGQFVLAVAERAERFRHGLVDDLEIAATGELLEFHQREIGFDPGRVAIHHKADCAGWRNHGCLCVAKAMLLAKCQGIVPRGPCMGGEALVLDGGVIERNGVDLQALIALCLAMRRAAVIADHAEHVGRVVLVACKRAELARHFGRGRIGNAGHDRGERTANAAAFFRIIRDTVRHQEAANIGIAQTERAEFIGEFGDFLGRELRHRHRDFEHDCPETHGMLIGFDLERAVRIAELQQVQRGEVAGRVIKEHIFRARI